MRSANGFYRGIGPMNALARTEEHDVRTVPMADDEPTGALAPGPVDVVLIHRYCGPRALRLAQAAKERGALVVWDNDDDIGMLPKSVVTHRDWTGIKWERRLAEMRKLFRFTDLVTTPSELLASRLREQGAPHVEVIENYVGDEFTQMARPERGGVTIGWIAGVEHQMDVERVPIREALQQLLDEQPEVAVATVGLGLGLRSARYHHIGAVTRTDLPGYLVQFHVGIAPLADIAFSRARSNVKLKEYAAAGMPWLASPVGPYAGMGEKQGGRLVADDGWHGALLRLVQRPRERGKLAKRAGKWAARETLSKNAGRWAASFGEAIERTAAARSATG